MNCSNCQTDNPSEAKFCMNCGTPLSNTCPKCEKQNPPAAKFCINCGSPISNAVSRTQDPIQRHLPKAFAEKLEVARESQTMKGERRIVTILFCDVKGSTAMAEKLDPEEWAGIINQAFEYLIAPIYQYEGTLARLMGDSILAFFGAPIAHEDDAQRAILAGLEIIRSIEPFRKKIEQRYQLDFNVRVGINTGLVVVGGVGSDLFMEYTALGDAINLAARMEQTAKPGTIQIAEDTYKKVAHFVDTEPVTGINIKGKSDPVKVFRVLRVKETPLSQRGIQGLEAPMIGRAAALENLTKILGEVKQGRGQIVSLVGEAGLGKSRLLHEVRRHWEAMDLGVGPFGNIESRWNQTYGVSYESRRPYGLIQRLVQNFIGISSSDSPDSIRNSLVETLGDTGVEISQQTLQMLETILSVREKNDENQLEGEELKKAIYRELSLTLDALVQQGPTIIAIDDLQWADQSSAEFIIHLFQLTNRLPILFICAFRPDRQSPAWVVKQAAETDYAHRYSEISLQPLSNTDSNALVDALFAHNNLPLEIRKLILDKSEGNPFFMEEVIRTLIDNDVLASDPNTGRLLVASSIDEITIPDNLHALLAARIDRLEETAKQVLQLASVIGRSFYHQVLKLICATTSTAISVTNGGLDVELNNLQRLGLILETEREPYLEYVFRQALTHETAYNTILLSQRRAFHKRVGEALLELYSDRIDEFASVIGHHFYQARDSRAMEFFRREGDSAFTLYANSEAVNYYSKAIEAGMWAENPDKEFLAYLYIQRGRACELDSHFSEAIKNYKKMEEFARADNDEHMALKALIAQAQIYSIPSTAFNSEIGFKLVEKTRTMAERLNDQPALAKILWITTNLYRFHHNLDEAQRSGEKAIALARELGLDELLAYCLTDTAHTYNMQGQVVEARDVSLEAAALWRQLNNQPMLADCLGGLAAIHVFAGEFDQAYLYSDEAYEISTRIENIWGQSYSRYAIGIVDMERGEVDLAIKHLNQSMKDARLSNFLAGEVLSKTSLSNLYSSLGHYRCANETIDSVFDVQFEDNIALVKSFLFSAKLLSHARAGKVDDAQELIEQNKTVVEQMNFFAKHLYNLGICYLSFARGDFTDAVRSSQKFAQQLQSTGVEYLTPELLLLVTKSQVAQALWDDARDTLKEAQRAVEKLGSRHSGWQVDYLLGRCALQQGDQTKADEYFQRSKDTLTYILEHIADADLRAHFSNHESVQHVFGTEPNLSL